MSDPWHYPNDPVMAGLEHALDPGRVWESLQGHWLRDRHVVESCRIERLRYSKRTRAVLSYRAQVVSRDSEQTSDLRFALYVYGKSKSRERYCAALASATAGSDCPVTAMVGYLPDMDAYAEAFPYDRNIPALVKFSASVPPDVLEALERDPVAARAFEGLSSVRVVRHRPGLMATVKIGADTTPAGAPKAYFVKLFAKGEVERSFAHAAALYGYWRGRDCGLLFPEPVAALPQHNALAYRCMAGVPLVEAIAADRDVSVVAERVADALIALHTSTPSRSLPPGGDRTLRKLRRTVAIGSWSLPVHADRIRRIADRTAEALRVSVSAPTHHDMKPEHVFVGKGSVGLIDVESLCLDVPTIDLGCLLARLDLTTSADPFIRIALRAAARAIESRYCSRAPARWLSTLSAAKAYGALLLVAHHVQGQGSDWAGQATRALDWAEFAIAPIGQRGLDGLGNAGAAGGTGRATTVQS